MGGGGFMKHAVDTVNQERRERKDRHDLHALQGGEWSRNKMDPTHVDFSHLSPEEIERTRQEIQVRYRKQRRKFTALILVIFGLLSIPFLYLMIVRPILNLILG